MLRLMVAGAGAGKSHWLAGQPARVRLDCTHMPHRAILCAIADALGVEYESRATVDVLLVEITAAAPINIALDNIDRSGGKLLYSIITLSVVHNITATATVARRVAVITERSAAVIVPPPKISLSDIARIHEPTLTAAQIRRVAMVAQSPAHAVTLARAIANGQPVPTPPTSDNRWIMLLVGVAVIALIRYTNPHMSPVVVAVITAGAYVLRRLLWRSL